MVVFFVSGTVVLDLFSFEVLTAVVFLLPKLTSGKTVEIPDVSDLSEKDASNKLTKLGLVVGCDESDYMYEPSDTVMEGYAVRTSPSAGTLVKEGKKVCIYLSNGDASFEMEDYSRKNYIEVKTILETKYNCNVLVEKQKVKESDKYNDDDVVSTSPKAGETVKYGSNVTIYIPEVEVLYPDFTNGYTVEKVQEWAKKYNIKVEVTYEDNSVLAPGTIIHQDRAKGSAVVEGITLSITVTRTPEIVDDIVMPEESENGEESSE